MIRCVVVPPGEGARELTVPGELADFQDLVCGYVEALPYPGGLLVLFDEDGLGKRAPLNRRLPETGARTVDGYFRGPLVFVRRDGVDFGSLEDDDVRKLLWRFREADPASSHGGVASAHR